MEKVEAPQQSPAAASKRLANTLLRYMRTTLPDREYGILERRFNLNGSHGKATLRQLGAEQALTRERIRQIEARALWQLHSRLQEFKGGADATLLSNAYAALGKSFQSAGGIIKRNEVDRVLSKHLGGQLPPQMVDILLRMRGLIPYRTGRAFGNTRCRMSDLVVRDKHAFSQVERITHAVHVAMRGVTGSIPFAQVRQAVQAAYRGREFPEVEFKSVLSSIQGLERKGDLLWVHFRYMRSWTERIHRILQDAQADMHLSELREEAVRRSEPNEKAARQLTNQQLSTRLANDPRFLPIGRSGRWKLAGWDHIQTVPVWRAMRNALEEAARPMPISELTDATLKVRPDASANSVMSYAGMHTEFMRVKDEGRGKMYALRSWGLEPHPIQHRKRPVSTEQFIAFIKEIMEDRNPIPLFTLVSELSQKMGITTGMLRQRLNRVRGLQFQPASPYPRKQVACRDFSKLEEVRRKSLSKLITSAIMDELKSRPGVPVRKQELYRRLQERVPCQRPLYYHCLSAMKEIKQYKENAFYYAVYNPPAA